MLSGRGLCEELIPRPEESYRVQRVYNLETPGLSRSWPAALYIDCVAGTLQTLCPGHTLSSVAFVFNATAPPVGQGLLIHEVFLVTHNDAPQSVGLLWTSDQPVAEIST
jgi:hypothetical protein